MKRWVWMPIARHLNLDYIVESGSEWSASRQINNFPAFRVGSHLYVNDLKEPSVKNFSHWNADEIIQLGKAPALFKKSMDRNQCCGSTVDHSLFLFISNHGDGGVDCTDFLINTAAVLWIVS